ncbi:MAG: hypothetical protein QOD47_107 [Gemmatimonadaceae bacterium]|jgi:hypothetical protein|nr:hypothetical protein [Gemmatimonadaceae bacterium]
MRILFVLALCAVALECERPDLVFEQAPPPTTFVGLRQLMGPPPTGPCVLPSVRLLVDSLNPITLGDSATLRLPPGWQTSALHPRDDEYADTRLALPGGARILIQRQRNGARGRSYLMYRPGVLAKGTTCTLERAQTGAIWSRYRPDPQDTTRLLKYTALGAVVTPAGHWYSVSLWTASESDQSRLASILTEAMLLPPR